MYTNNDKIDSTIWAEVPPHGKIPTGLKEKLSFRLEQRWRRYKRHYQTQEKLDNILEEVLDEELHSTVELNIDDIENIHGIVEEDDELTDPELLHNDMDFNLGIEDTNRIKSNEFENVTINIFFTNSTF